MEQTIVSIITPCYNAAQYLQRCLDSLRKQNLQEWEAIVIDDGSKDATPDIGKRYSEIDNRIKFISKKNEGVSITRNCALKIIQGKYVFFLDSDDYLLTPDTLQTLVTKMENQSLDYIRFEYTAVDQDEHILFENKNKYLSLKWNEKIISPYEYLKRIALPRDEFYLCMCVFRASIIRKNNLLFIPNCRYREDADFILRYLGYCNKTRYLTSSYYAYRKHDSAATTGDKNYSNDIKMLVNSLTKYNNKCNNATYNKLIDFFIERLIKNSSVKDKFRIIFKKIKREFLFMLYQ